MIDQEQEVPALEVDTTTTRGAAAPELVALRLRYVGTGAALPDVPARDLAGRILAVALTHYSLEQLVASGLYQQEG